MSFASPPSRVVTLAPSLGEIVASILEEDWKKIVAVSDYSDYPLQLRSLPSVGPFNRLNLEKIISLKPDLVLATMDGNSKDQVEHLKELGVRVKVLRVESLQELADSFVEVAAALGLPQRGKRLREKFLKDLSAFHSRESPLKVIVQLGEDPLVVAGGKTLIHELLEKVGVKNLYEETDSRYPRPSWEDAILKRPDLVLILTMGNERKQYEKMKKRWEQHSITAKIVDGDLLVRPTSRVIEGLQLLVKILDQRN